MKIRDKKLIGLIILLIVVIILSIITYNKNKKYVFKDECKDSIFVEKNDSDKTVIEEDKTKEQIDKNKKIIVEIKGEVQKPDVYEMQEGSIVRDLIEEAGGLTANAYIKNINRAEELHNHQLVVIDNKNEIDTIGVVNGGDTINTGSMNSLININTATKEQLQNISGIGPSKAEAIISYREENGDFKKLEDIMNVSGIGEKSFEKIKAKITL